MESTWCFHGDWIGCHHQVHLSLCRTVSSNGLVSWSPFSHHHTEKWGASQECHGDIPSSLDGLGNILLKFGGFGETLKVVFLNFLNGHSLKTKVRGSGLAMFSFVLKLSQPKSGTSHFGNVRVASFVCFSCAPRYGIPSAMGWKSAVVRDASESHQNCHKLQLHI